VGADEREWVGEPGPGAFLRDEQPSAPGALVHVENVEIRARRGSLENRQRLVAPRARRIGGVEERLELELLAAPRAEVRPCEVEREAVGAAHGRELHVAVGARAGVGRAWGAAERALDHARLDDCGLHRAVRAPFDGGSDDDVLGHRWNHVLGAAGANDFTAGEGTGDVDLRVTGHAVQRFAFRRRARASGPRPPATTAPMALAANKHVSRRPSATEAESLKSTVNTARRRSARLP
jgi:hypothetical protein